MTGSAVARPVPEPPERGIAIRGPAPPAQEPNELEALARLGFDELGRAVRGIGDIQATIARRAFRAVGAPAGLVRPVYEAIATRAFGAVAHGFSLVGRAGAKALPARSLSPTPLGSGVLAVIDGLIGDELERERSALQKPMAVRVDGRIVPCERDAVARAFPGATRRMVVFVHGLMGTEFPWRWFAAENGGPYGTLLARDLDLPPVYVRYNLG